MLTNLKNIFTGFVNIFPENPVKRDYMTNYDWPD